MPPGKTRCRRCHPMISAAVACRDAVEQHAAVLGIVAGEPVEPVLDRERVQLAGTGDGGRQAILGDLCPARSTRLIAIGDGFGRAVGRELHAAIGIDQAVGAKYFRRRAVTDLDKQLLAPERFHGGRHDDGSFRG